MGVCRGVAVSGDRVLVVVFGCLSWCCSESEKALGCFLDAARDLMVDNFLMTMMSQLSRDSNAHHIEVLYYLQVSVQAAYTQQCIWFLSKPTYSYFDTLVKDVFHMLDDLWTRDLELWKL